MNIILKHNTTFITMVSRDNVETLRIGGRKFSNSPPLVPLKKITWGAVWGVCSDGSGSSERVTGIELLCVSTGLGI